MANPSKKKGTEGEVELKAELVETIPGLVRTPPTSYVDLAAPGETSKTLLLLATRPDWGEWLVTMDLSNFRDLFRTAYPDGRYAPNVGIEVKRHKSFALHNIWAKKFGRR